MTEGPYRDPDHLAGAPTCPRCRPAVAPLRSAEIGPTPLLECGCCNGVWLRAPAFQDLLVDMERQEAVLAVAAPAPRFESEVHYLLCPECGEMMVRRNLVHSGLMLDICRFHGIWLDEGELRRVVELVRGGKLYDWLAGRTR
jgi:Zn-finger nucleic acid-binding protein